MPEVIEALCDRHVVAIAAGHTHSMVLTDKGKVLSFGSSLGVLCMSRLFRHKLELRLEQWQTLQNALSLRAKSTRQSLTSHCTLRVG